MNIDKGRAIIRRPDSGMRTIWRTWLRPAIATIGRGNFHVDRMG